jgi:uncharacterized protein
MDVRYRLNGQDFIWNSDKALHNLSKHGISFENACEVFFDPFLRIEDASPQGEARQAAIGRTEDWDLLFVVHMTREEEVIRIVSARPATARERSRYENE